MSENPVNNNVLLVKRLSETAKLPVKAHATDAGYDIFCDHPFVLDSLGYDDPYAHVSLFAVKVRTGISLGIPSGHYVRIAEKSGLASKGVKVNGGVIDEGYTGEIIVLLSNISDNLLRFERGDKIAQLILEKISSFPVMEVDSLTDSERAANGFGSTGSK